MARTAPARLAPPRPRRPATEPCCRRVTSTRSSWRHGRGAGRVRPVRTRGESGVRVSCRPSVDLPVLEKSTEFDVLSHAPCRVDRAFGSGTWLQRRRGLAPAAECELNPPATNLVREVVPEQTILTKFGAEHCHGSAPETRKPPGERRLPVGCDLAITPSSGGGIRTRDLRVMRGIWGGRTDRFPSVHAGSGARRCGRFRRVRNLLRNPLGPLGSSQRAGFSSRRFR